MLRVVNLIVDGYLDLRRELTRQLDHWQAELIDPRSRFTNWSALMEARQSLHHLDEICEDQRAAIQDWIDALETLPPPEGAAAQRERELIMVRSRDVLEHIERVVHHVRRLEQNAETAVQMHFSVQSHRANDIMRVLTALTAIFLPLNLIAGIFGMNFEFIPLVHKADGFWIAMASMAAIALLLVVVFWRKRYLARTQIQPPKKTGQHSRAARFSSRIGELLGRGACRPCCACWSVAARLGMVEITRLLTREPLVTFWSGAFAVATACELHGCRIRHRSERIGAARTAGHVLVGSRSGANSFGFDFGAVQAETPASARRHRFRLGRRRRPEGREQQQRGFARSSFQFLGNSSEWFQTRLARWLACATKFPGERPREIT